MNDIFAAAGKARAARARLAAHDFDEFVPFVFVAEDTGQAMEQAPIHQFWTRLRGNHRLAVIESAAELGKTVQLGVAYPIFMLGQDPKVRIAIISDTQSSAKKIVRAIGQNIEKNPRLKEVFPDLKPGGKWTETTLEVQRPFGIRDPSVQAFGFTTGQIQGSRLDVIILDDVLIRDNTRTKHMRDGVEDRFWKMVFNRLTDDGRCYIIGNTWHPDDLLHRLHRQGWPKFRFPVIVDEEMAAYDDAFKLGESAWPEHWPMARIEHVRRKEPPVEFNRIRRCIPAAETTSRFIQEWFDWARERGHKMGFHEQAALLQDVVSKGRVPEDAHIVAGVDLATGKGRDESAIAVVLGRSNGDRALIHLRAGDWKAPELVEHIIDVYRRFRCTVVVESVGGQDLFRQLLAEHTDIPVVPFDTNSSVKFHPTHGVESWAVELMNKKWIFPGDRDKEIDKLIEEAVTYTPEAHTGDRLMSVFFCREHLRGLLEKTPQLNAGAFAGFSRAMLRGKP